MPEMRRGVAFGLSAYILWGLFPLYVPLLRPAGTLEILAHRVLWSLVIVAAVLLGLRRWSSVRALFRQPRRLALLSLAAVAIGVNWGVFVWGATHQHVIEISLGYFINPLVSVVFGMLIFRERLRRAQWLAVGLAAVAVVVLVLGYGRLPWVSAVLALAFGTYGMLKKAASTGTRESVMVEMTILAVPAITYLAFLEARGTATFGHLSLAHSALLAGSGVATVVPLLCFGAAATRVPLSVLGLMQYLTPSLQFVIGLFVFGEPLPPGRLAGFALVWVALAILATDALRARRGTAAARRGTVGQPVRSST